MIATLKRTYGFQSAHWLPGVPEGHRCRNMHGHNYKMDVVVTGTVDEKTGFVIDFADIDKVVDPLLKLVDHKVLNEVSGLENPTAELIAKWFYVQIEDLFADNILTMAVNVHENDRSTAAYVGRE